MSFFSFLKSRKHFTKKAKKNVSPIPELSCVSHYHSNLFAHSSDFDANNNRPSISIVIHDHSNHWFVNKQDCETLLQGQMSCSEVVELGIGAFGIGFSLIPSEAIVDKKTTAESEHVAVKAFSFGKNWSLDPKRRVRHSVFANEVECYSKRLDHKHIVEYKGHFKLFWQEHKQDYLVEKSLHWTEKNPAYSQLLMGGVVMEKLRCTLKDWAIDQKIDLLDDRLITALFYQIGKALVYLHRTHYMTHNDLKADNVGISHFDEDGLPYLKLLDFGNAIDYCSADYMAAERHSMCLNLDSQECDIKHNNGRVLYEDNAFLEESHKFAEMIRGCATVKAEDLVMNSSIVAERFEKIQMKDSRLKRLLTCMARKNSCQQISINRVMKYLAGK